MAAVVNKVSFPVSGMTCAACQGFLEKILSKQPGVDAATVNLMLHTATVTYRPTKLRRRRLLRQCGRQATAPISPARMIQC
jgi:P-type Cu+ transporter